MKTELKTLKDIPLPILQSFEIRKLLKSEAVKWVKEKTCNEKDIEWIMNEWIKHFFNLTEEDLK